MQFDLTPAERKAQEILQQAKRVSETEARLKDNLGRLQKLVAAVPAEIKDGVEAVIGAERLAGIKGYLSIPVPADAPVETEVEA